MEWIWKAVLIILGGTIILRIAGRKSISQMTLSQTVIMIAIGSLLIQPVSSSSVWETFGVGAMLVFTLIMMEFLQVRFDVVERFLTGRAVPVIVNGQLQEKQLKKLRFTVDQLEMKLRQQNITSMDDVESATLEPNGQVGVELKKGKQPATRQDMETLKQELNEIKQVLHVTMTYKEDKRSVVKGLFKEVEGESHESGPPDRLL